MVEIGKIIRAFRNQRKMTLKALAVESDISPSYLSQIENDQVNMNMSVLEKISNALKVPIYMFFLQENINNISFIKNGERDKVVRNDNVTIELLTGPQITSMDIHIMDIPPKYKSPEYASHQGEEFMHVLEGGMTIDFSGYKSITLGIWDSVAYSSRIPHSISSEEGCKVLVNSTTPPIGLI